MTLQDFLTDWHSTSPTLLVHTSGSTGKPKPLLVEKHRMLASARITCDFLGLKPNDTALLCLPLDYIAGKMMVVRSIERQLNLTSVEPSNHPLQSLVHIPQPSTLNTQPTFFDLIAMVPSQVYATLQSKEEAELLKKTRHLIIGGGSISKELHEQLKDFPNNVWSTYGMTETLSHIALRKLNGHNSSEWYTPFNEVEISLTADNCLQIHAPQVNPDILTTNDIAELNPNDNRQFRILGRKDNIICSGGIKLQIEQIEEALRPLINMPFAISKRPDPQYGEVPILVIEDIEDLDHIDHLESMENLPKYAHPKQIIKIDKIPITETGKIARAKLAELIQS